MISLTTVLAVRIVLQSEKYNPDVGWILFLCFLQRSQSFDRSRDEPLGRLCIFVIAGGNGIPLPRWLLFLDVSTIDSTMVAAEARLYCHYPAFFGRRVSRR
ncbi:unnamed protein product [Somion occarium]|uniref:Uncharacterized protein n=1 Tax=Somion occarium TaxID=3059160 RepID=A0ABP1CR81_9APHY